jgi:SAM-dependent methyltransferase
MREGACVPKGDKEWSKNHHFWDIVKGCFFQYEAAYLDTSTYFDLYSSQKPRYFDERSVVLMSDELREQVKHRYAEAALAVQATESQSSCREPSCCSGEAQAEKVDLTGGSYTAEELGDLPESATLASLGCGNPVALATLSPGEVVLDLGSGGGIDVLLSARRVAPNGKAYGLDMTDEMLALAHKNQQEAGVENAEFLKGELEDIPLPDEHVDVVISNCVINLSTEKERAIREAYRVLKPTGRFTVSDMVFLGQKSKLPPEVVRSIGLWSGCVSGALEQNEYEELLAAAGFEDISVEITHTYDEAAVSAMSGCCGGSEQYADARSTQALQEMPLASAFIRARKPQQ